MTDKPVLNPVTTEEECAEIAGLAWKIWREHYTPIIGSAQVDYMLQRFQSADAVYRQIHEEGYRYMVLRIGDLPAGYLSTRICTDHLFLSKIYVDSPWRGRGFGRLLMDHAETMCRNNGYKELRLTVNRNNTRSIAAYLRMGFVNAGAIRQDIGGGFVMDDYLMIKALS